MLIDFHTHVFPEKIANSAISSLEQKANNKAFTDGTCEGLLKNMINGGCDISVTLPVLTNPLKFDSVNSYALSINEKYSDSGRKLISFGGIHPKCDNLHDKMKWLKDNGFLGVKLHPDYQNTFFDDQGYVDIVNYAKEFDLIVVTHAGIDAGYLDQPVKCPPTLAKKVIDKTNYGKIVFAHLGGLRLWEDVLDILAGTDVYFDTADIFPFIKEDLFKKILLKHGEDRIVFATDCPWNDIKTDVDMLKSYNLEKSVFDKITYKNALKLLKIEE